MTGRLCCEENLSWSLRQKQGFPADKLTGSPPWLQLIGKSSFFGLIISLAWTLSAQAMELRVAISKGVSNVRVGSSTPALVKNAGGATIGRLDSLVPANATASGRNINLAGMQASQITIEPSGDGRIWIGDRWYRGKVRLIRQGNGVSAVNLVDIEEYLYSVVGSEAIPSWRFGSVKSPGCGRPHLCHLSN
ncbi:hypothetical protein NON20_18195 [Synechocystis sp. B12]|nr:hypothetical protein NON20_18195 [Synechocystis sp. B12]